MLVEKMATADFLCRRCNMFPPLLMSMYIGFCTCGAKILLIIFPPTFGS